MQTTKSILQANEKELDLGHIEGDLLVVFEQYGHIADVHLVRDQDTGKSKGFAFIGYEDQRSTILAVDNFNGTVLLGRTLRVDHVAHYKKKVDDSVVQEEEELFDQNRENTVDRERVERELRRYIRPVSEESDSGKVKSADELRQERVLAQIRAKKRVEEK
ncbi:Zinc finger CCCH domain-containing protein 42 [Galdieria sulphuraria]|nr:Zinc finger CCCH domain-containing protein 42 [Galdieria sulphuraria]